VIGQGGLCERYWRCAGDDERSLLWEEGSVVRERLRRGGWLTTKAAGEKCVSTQFVVFRARDWQSKSRKRADQTPRQPQSHLELLPESGQHIKCTTSILTNPSCLEKRQAIQLLNPEINCVVSQEEMKYFRLPMEYRDWCAHLLIPLNQCRNREFHAPWRCTDER